MPSKRSSGSRVHHAKCEFLVIYVVASRDRVGKFVAHMLFFLLSAAFHLIREHATGHQATNYFDGFRYSWRARCWAYSATCLGTFTVKSDILDLLVLSDAADKVLVFAGLNSAFPGSKQQAGLAC